MPCRPLTDDLFSTSAPPFGFNVGSVSLGDLNIPFPDLPLDKLEDLFNALGMLLPSGLVKPHFHSDVLNDVMSAIMNFLNTFMPFLMLYKFLLPVLNLILCILEVLCSLTNPFKVIRALRRLFRRCIPEFLSLFPFFALILMIIALILLIIALIEYIIQRILSIIETILRNILLLNKAVSALNNDSIIAIVKKIGDLLCLLQNIFILFAVFNTIFQIIQAIASLSFRIPPCDNNDGDDGCCGPDVCPAFIKNNETIARTTGTFKYLRQVAISSGLSLPVGFAPIYSELRAESWQFFDASSLTDQEFINITTPYDTSNTFFPEGVVYTKQSNYKKTPYYISFKVWYRPTDFDRVDILGNRYIRIVNAIVKEPPKAYVDGYYNTQDTPNNGTLSLIGGTVTEDYDGAPPILNGDGSNATINDYFHKDTLESAALPIADDAIDFTNVEYTFTINHPELMNHQLITAGCVPSLAIERDALAATIGEQFNTNGLNLTAIIATLPSMSLDPINQFIEDYRKEISTDTTLKLKDNLIGHLNNLRDQSVNALVEAITAAYDQYKSDFTLEPSIQFTTRSIKLMVLLKDTSGNSLTTNIPIDAATKIALKLNAFLNFGEIDDFIYDGELYFVANISNTKPGNGTIQVAYDNKIIGTILNSDNIDQELSVENKQETYTFVVSQALPDGSPQRDNTDTSRME